MTDQSGAVSDALAAKAIDLFDRDYRSTQSLVFRLRPAFLGNVRQGGEVKRFLYELGDDMMIQLEQTVGEPGIDLLGFADCTDDGPVVLYGDGYQQETQLSAGSFAFSAIPEGTFALSFTLGEQTFWVMDLELREESSA